MALLDTWTPNQSKIQLKQEQLSVAYAQLPKKRAIEQEIEDANGVISELSDSIESLEQRKLVIDQMTLTETDPEAAWGKDTFDVKVMDSDLAAYVRLPGQIIGVGLCSETSTFFFSNLYMLWGSFDE